MASRSFLSGLLAVGMTATALHVANAPAAPSLQDTPAASHGSTALNRGRKPALSMPSWSDQLDRDPSTAGEASAAKDFAETLCPEPGAATRICIPDGTGLQPAAADMQANVVFAIVPDPIHTHLALWFDRSIDSLEDGLTDSGWRYDRNWLPWSLDPVSPSSVKFKDREQERLFLSKREDYPGIIIFRPPPLPQVPPEAALPAQVPGEIDPQKPLVVFVIGDSPTSGVNQTQFQKAVGQFHRIAAGLQTLKIIGPTFTGSGPSLSALLAEAKKKDLAAVRVNIASGSVSDGRCGNLLDHGRLQEVEKDLFQCNDASVWPHAVDTFASFDADFVWQIRQTERYLMEKGGLRPDEIAQLNEDESSFGGLATSEVSDPTAISKTSEKEKRILKLTYPRNISHLRSAYQKNGVWGFGGTSSGTGSISLNLDFDDTSEADDSVPSFAKGQLPVSQEATLGQVSAILEQRHIKAVILSATDVLDELFVAQIIARQNPTIAIIIRGTDDLFLRSGDRGVYHNMYAVSPWPLIPKNAIWSQQGLEEHPGVNVRVFASSEIEGLYTATRFLLPGSRALDTLQDYRSPIQAKEGQGAWPHRPPLWLLAIGHGAYWPFALLPEGAGPADAAEAAKGRSPFNLPILSGVAKPVGLDPDAEPLPTTTQFMIFVLCMLCLLHAGKCFDVGVLRRVAPRYRISEPAVRAPKRWLQIALSVDAALILALMAHPVAHLNFVHYLCLLGEAALCAALVWSAFDLLPARFHVKPRRTHAILAVVGCILFCLDLLAWRQLWHFLPPSTLQPDGLREFFYYRSHFALSGASPVFPLVLALTGIGIYLLAQLDRFTFGPRLAPRLPGDVSGISNCPSEASVGYLTGLLSYPAPSLGVMRTKFSILCGLAVLAAICGALAHLAPLTFDGWHLRVCADAVMFLLLITIFWDLVMGHYLWRQLKDVCLEPLELSALRRGFNSVSGMTWQDLWIMPQSHTSLRQYQSFIRALEQTERAGLGHVAGLARLKTNAERLWLRRAEGASLDEITRRFSLVQRLTARVAETVLHQQHTAWAGERVRTTAADEPGPLSESEEAETIRPSDPALADAQQAVSPVIREEWISLIFLHYIRMVLTHIRSRLLTAAILYLILVWSITSYPYLNRHVLLIALSVVFGILAVVIVTTYASINRDPILNRTTKNKANKLDFDFYFKTVPIIGLPLLGLIASQFPEISSFVFSWLEPSMAAVK
ncbi:hypothetical protein [Granulicella tundricola]|uniref:Uncharacterized protein n=1 Tax=Granulicella tundricola (strain ATCC BAA-1859 / DSM 23138 / MP5ACTX9) TaxID=1198114 RepID=E8X0M6_GRATM|nr:hypothetical protein [Granulicella tundricola]ADW68977.1 hypothetical protein AciX9_1931 [Granulicella tundricola MP5ACTX9]